MNNDGTILQGRWNIGRRADKIPSEYKEFSQRKLKGFHSMMIVCNLMAFVITLGMSHYFG